LQPRIFVAAAAAALVAIACGSHTDGGALTAERPTPQIIYITPAPAPSIAPAPMPTPLIVYVTPPPTPMASPTPTPKPTPRPTPRPTLKPTPRPTPTPAPLVRVKKIAKVTNQIGEFDYAVSVDCPKGYLLLKDSTRHRMFSNGKWGNTRYVGGYTGDMGEFVYGDYDGPLDQGWTVGTDGGLSADAGGPDNPVTVWARCFKWVWVPAK